MEALIQKWRKSRNTPLKSSQKESALMLSNNNQKNNQLQSSSLLFQKKKPIILFSDSDSDSNSMEEIENDQELDHQQQEQPPSSHQLEQQQVLLPLQYENSLFNLSQSKFNPSSSLKIQTIKSIQQREFINLPQKSQQVKNSSIRSPQRGSFENHLSIQDLMDDDELNEQDQIVKNPKKSPYKQKKKKKRTKKNTKGMSKKQIQKAVKSNKKQITQMVEETTEFTKEKLYEILKSPKSISQKKSKINSEKKKKNKKSITNSINNSKKKKVQMKSQETKLMTQSVQGKLLQFQIDDACYKILDFFRYDQSFTQDGWFDPFLFTFFTYNNLIITNFNFQELFKKVKEIIENLIDQQNQQFIRIQDQISQLKQQTKKAEYLGKASIPSKRINELQFVIKSLQDDKIDLEDDKKRMSARIIELQNLNQKRDEKMDQILKTQEISQVNVEIIQMIKQNHLALEQTNKVLQRQIQALQSEQSQKEARWSIECQELHKIINSLKQQFALQHNFISTNNNNQEFSTHMQKQTQQQQQQEEESPYFQQKQF